MGKMYKKIEKGSTLGEKESNANKILRRVEKAFIKRR